MKNTKWLLGAAVLALGVVSCKSEKEKMAEKTVENYAVYVDSLDKLENDAAKQNWTAIEASYEIRTAEAELALENLNDKIAAQERINSSKLKYETRNAKLQAEINAEQKVVATTAIKNNPSQMLRDRFFGAGRVGADMSFAWVNKDNILQVYQNFFESYKANKGSFSREDFDETKLMYEALDSRKNTVEKEGLSGDDNGKIASIKFKFAPMFKVNRIGAKARENEAAKE